MIVFVVFQEPCSAEMGVYGITVMGSEDSQCVCKRVKAGNSYSNEERRGSSRGKSLKQGGHSEIHSWLFGSTHSLVSRSCMERSVCNCSVCGMEEKMKFLR